MQVWVSEILLLSPRGEGRDGTRDVRGGAMGSYRLCTSDADVCTGGGEEVVISRETGRAFSC